MSSVVTAQDLTCPDVDTPPCEERFYSHPTDCSAYYQCTAGCVAYYFECPSELHFDPDLQQCVSPVDYPCTGNADVTFAVHLYVLKIMF